MQDVFGRVSGKSASSKEHLYIYSASFYVSRLALTQFALRGSHGSLDGFYEMHKD